jgi:hypothetical protein
MGVAVIAESGSSPKWFLAMPSRKGSEKSHSGAGKGLEWTAKYLVGTRQKDCPEPYLLFRRVA